MLTLTITLTLTLTLILTVTLLLTLTISLTLILTLNCYGVNLIANCYNAFPMPASKLHSSL